MAHWEACVGRGTGSVRNLAARKPDGNAHAKRRGFSAPPSEEGKLKEKGQRSYRGRLIWSGATDWNRSTRREQGLTIIKGGDATCDLSKGGGRTGRRREERVKFCRGRTDRQQQTGHNLTRIDPESARAQETRNNERRQKLMCVIADVY
jgi:hypothetical protein